MNPFLLTIAVFVFLSGAYFGNRNIFVKSQDNEVEISEQKEVLAETDENATGIDVGPTIKPFPRLVTAVPSKVSPTPTQNSIFSKLVYPKSLVISQTYSKINLTSMDKFEDISNWYKAKIKELDLSSGSTLFIQEEGKYEIKLTGEKIITIDIEEEENGPVKIEMELE